MKERYKILSRLNKEYVIGIIKKDKVVYMYESKVIKRYFNDVNEVLIDNLDVVKINNIGKYKYEYIKSMLIHNLIKRLK